MARGAKVCTRAEAIEAFVDRGASWCVWAYKDTGMMGLCCPREDGAWQKLFKTRPDVFTAEEKRAWLDKAENISLGSDAFFPFSDNIERAKKSGVRYVAEPGGSVRDDAVIECCDKYGMAMAFTGIRLFHH